MLGSSFLVCFILIIFILIQCGDFVEAKAATTVSFDGRSFFVNNERKLFISGSIHYPRASRGEWSQIFQLAKESGLNLIQTYVFWDIHEPENNQWFYPTDSSSSNDLAAFIEEAGKQGLYVHLRISGYVCAEWNNGGMPSWLRSMNTTFRTFDDVWMHELAEYFEKTISVVNDAKLLAKDGGPIIMMQIENEYGNMEKYYGVNGRKYVKWLSEYATSLTHRIGGIPWVMCQQGEGTGSAPSASIVNACNGFYCDNWISKHANDFPNQPHMWTENWPGWFQNWGEPIPHRPSVDVAFAVARWFARGGSYMNYYMAFGGTTFGRSVGGPLIVTSYDYDVQIDEYAMRAEPKFTLLQQLHEILHSNTELLLQQMPPPAVPLDGQSSCESHFYRSSNQCLAFFSNWGTESCTFSLENGQITVVPAWSVSIANGPSCSNLIYNTKNSASAIKSNQKFYRAIDGFALSHISIFEESIPSYNTEKKVPQITSEQPLEQLAITLDKTDYLWYSSTVSQEYSVDTNVTLSFSSGTAGGGLFYIYANGKRVGSVLGNAGGPPVNKGNLYDEHGIEFKDEAIPVRTTITLPAGSNINLDILSVSMGLKNYGPYLEKIKVGILTDVYIDQIPLKGFVQSVGLTGEYLDIPNKGISTPSSTGCKSLCWYSSTFSTPPSVLVTSKLALDVGASMGKGSVWINGHMLGRYWDVIAEATASQRDCTGCGNDYIGSFNGDKCRTGCGLPSQQYYKLPADWLNYGEDAVNSIVLFDELGGIPQNIKLMEVTMI